MATEFQLSYTASDIDKRLGKIDILAEKTELPTKTSELINDSGFATELYVHEYAQPVGDYVLKSEMPEIPDFPVQSVNGYTGYVNLSATDVGALPDSTVIPVVPTNVSDFVNDMGYLTEHQSLDGLATENYVDTKISLALDSDVVVQIAEHNTSASSHSDIRAAIAEMQAYILNIDYHQHQQEHIQYYHIP